MLRRPVSSPQVGVPPVTESLGEIDLHGEFFGVGGGDPYIAQLIQEARAKGLEVCERTYGRRQPESLTFRPPGYESQE
jgi:hypothetical protein